MSDSSETRDVLAKLKSEVFDGSEEKLALALGKPTDEIIGWLTGSGIDEDAREKINGLAQERLSD